MNKRSLFTLGLSMLLISPIARADNILLPELLPLKVEVQTLPLTNIASLEAEDEDENGIGGDDIIPASELYAVWNNMHVNPYQVPIDSVLTDSVSIDFSTFTFPLAIFYRVTSEFGPRRYRYHYGIDLKLERGDTVRTVLDGMVRIAKKMKGYGNIVVVRHYNGMESFYGHLSKILVEPDQVVKSGDLIGWGGNTGRSTGPHLHLELRYLGQPINPRDIIDFDNLVTKSDTLVLSQENFKYRKNPKAGKTGGRVWTIKNGDSLGRISAKTGVSIKKLCALNGISSKKILKVGQKIHY